MARRVGSTVRSKLLMAWFILAAGIISACSAEVAIIEPPATMAAPTPVNPPELELNGTKISTNGPQAALPTLMPTTVQSFPPVATPTLRATPVPFCDKPGEVLEDNYFSRTAGEQMDYRIYLPPCYGGEDRLYPTIYLFHGSHHSDSHWEDLGITEAADLLINNQEITPLIIVMPDGAEIAQETSGGPTSFEAVVINDLLPHIEETYCSWTNPLGRAVGGLSRGGYWALEIAFRNPTIFHSVGGHSAALLDESAGSRYDPLISAREDEIDPLRIYLDSGKNDYVLAQLLELREVLLEERRDLQWILGEGSHEDSYWSSHLQDYLLWYSEPWSTEVESYSDCVSDSPDR